MTIKSLTSLTLVALATSLSQTAIAASEWQFEATPYIWAAGLDGTLGVEGTEADVDVSFDTLSDHIDTAFMGSFTARKGAWTYGFDGMYNKLSDDVSGSVTGPGGLVEINGKLKITTEMSIYQGTIFYNVSDHDTRVELLAALRYTEIDNKMELDLSTNLAAFPGRDAKVSGSESWTDLVVGLNVEYPFTDSLHLVGYADVGGNSDDDTYQLMATVNWEFSKDWIAKLGYREISWDYKNDGVTWDIRQSGSYLGLGYRF